MFHPIEALAKIGVVEVVIAINYQAHHIKNSLEPLEEKYKIKITYSQETEALGTAGPLKLAEDILRKDNEEGLFFVFNSDIICDYPLAELLAFQREKGQ
jgi:mannose-1-phosphate guanylyltransferase